VLPDVRYADRSEAGRATGRRDGVRQRGGADALLPAREPGKSFSEEALQGTGSSALTRVTALVHARTVRQG